jgi:hypothetical protein
MNLISIIGIIVLVGAVVAGIIYINKKGEPYRPPLRGSRPAIRAWRRPEISRGFASYNDIRGYQRPYGYWRNYVQPYPSYSLGRTSRPIYDRFDYTNEYNGDLCHARISTEDAFGPYAHEMGSQAWRDWAGRQGFQKVYLLRNNSGTNDHAIVKYVGECEREKRRPPNSKYYESFNATPQSY